MERDAVEVPVVCVGRDEMMLKEMKAENAPGPSHV